MSRGRSSGSPAPPWSRRDWLRRIAVTAGSMAAGSLAPGRAALTAAEWTRCQELNGARIRWLIGWSAGGGYDVYSRLLEPTLEARLGAQLVLENLPGAGGLLSARRLMRSDPDGRTLAILNGTGLSLAPALGLQVRPDFESDLTVLARVVGHRQALIVGTDASFASLESVVETGRRRPLVLGVTGLATANTLLTALLRPLFGVEVQLVAGYPGSRDIMAAIARGELDGAIAGIETPLPLDNVRIVLRFERDDGLANATDPVYADVPPLSGPEGVLAQNPRLFARPVAEVESTVDELLELMEVGRIVAAPPGLPARTRDCLRETVLGALDDPSFRQAAARAGRTVDPATHVDVIRRFRTAQRAAARWSEVLDELVRRANLSR